MNDQRERAAKENVDVCSTFIRLRYAPDAHTSTPTGEYEVDVAQDHSQASAAAAYVGGTATATAVGAPG